MDQATQFSNLSEVHADWLIVGIWENEELTEDLKHFNGKLDKALSRLRQNGDITGKANEVVTLLDPKGINAQRLLVIGLGKRDKADRASLHDAAATAARSITGKKHGRIAFALPAGVPELGWEQVALTIGVGLMQGCYGPGLRKNQPDRFPPDEILLVAPPSAPDDQVRAGARRSRIEGEAVEFARELVNTPPCDLYPETFAQRARDATANLEIDCKVYDEKWLEAERMGALLGVARGSDRPPRLVVMAYRKGADGRTLGLVGKGVTFDSGGLSLKTSEQMVDMKCDMAGAAAVLAALVAVAELQLPVNLLGVLALVENLPSGRALKLGDVLTTRSGKTIEVLNTDAEGRLILADALSYAVEQKVDHLVDLATLTGACMVALGADVAGLMGNNEKWCRRVLAASQRAGERAWQLPMFSLFDDMIKSKVADIKNTGGTRYGGAITAAKLLEQFVGDVPWAHLDIAGPAWAESDNPSRDTGGTGCFVRTLIELAREYGEK
ncbi:MAG TPA: leucyl aminopeptidase [Gemmataceae bacterium]|jgi:leucyl aminopeptidase|nr:leucyl aminopeptidase [Gemmataceae bacterium]